MIKEITIYEKTNTNGVLYLYCEDCKPRGGKRGTLVTGSYDHCCQGCGESFLELAQDVTPEPEPVEYCQELGCFNEAITHCQYCHTPICQEHRHFTVDGSLCDECFFTLGEDDEEMSPSDIAAIREAMSQPSLGTFSFAELCQVLEQERKCKHATY